MYDHGKRKITLYMWQCQMINLVVSYFVKQNVNERIYKKLITKPDKKLNMNHVINIKY